jgi:hypothetical protein
MNVEPFADHVAIAGPDAHKCDQIDDLIRLLVTVRSRFGNTAVRYRVQWGSAALWADDAQKREIEKLLAKVKRLKAKKVSA